jgi:hypothetical protein
MRTASLCGPTHVVTSSLLGTNGHLVFSAADLEAACSQVVRQQAVVDDEARLVNALLAKFPSRRQQVAEWTRVTGKCRRAFEHRLAACGLLKTTISRA